MASNIVLNAYFFAEKAHRGMTRKSNTSIPYILHPAEVAKILYDAEFSEEVVAAGFLHDVVEDTPFTIADIENLFGKNIAKLVSANTEDKTKSWEDRKQHTIETIQTQTLEEKSLIIADKLSNLTSFIEEWNKKGESVWNSFKRGREKQAWYFTGVLQGGFKNVPKDQIPLFFYEFEEKVHSFFG